MTTLKTKVEFIVNEKSTGPMTIDEFIDKFGQMLEKAIERNRDYHREQEVLFSLIVNPVEETKTPGFPRSELLYHNQETTSAKKIMFGSNKKESIADAIERLTDGVEVILDKDEEEFELILDTDEEEEVEVEEQEQKQVFENISEFTNDVVSMTTDELTQKYDLTPEESENLKSELGIQNIEISSEPNKKMGGQNTMAQSFQEENIEKEQASDLSWSEVRKVYAFYKKRKGDKLMTTKTFGITEEKLMEIVDRFVNRFASEEERNAKVTEMYESGRTNSEIKDECCIINDAQLYKLFNDLGLPKRNTHSRKAVPVDLNDDTSKLVIEMYTTGEKTTTILEKTGIPSSRFYKILGTAIEAGLVQDRKQNK